MMARQPLRAMLRCAPRCRLCRRRFAAAQRRDAFSPTPPRDARRPFMPPHAASVTPFRLPRLMMERTPCLTRQRFLLPLPHAMPRAVTPPTLLPPPPAMRRMRQQPRFAAAAAPPVCDGAPQ